MRWFLLTVVAVIVILVVAFFRMPASVVGVLLTEAESRQLLPPDTPKVSLADFDGTLWRGRAGKSAVLIDGVRVDLGEVNWTLGKVSLLRGAPLVDFTTRSTEIHLKGTVSVDKNSRVAIRGVEGRAPVSVLEPWMPLLVTGDIAFFIDSAVFVANRPESLNGLINLEYIDWVGADYNMPLGSYMAEVSLIDHNRVSVVINDLQARLGLTGTLNIDLQGHYQFQARLQPRPELAPEVATAIRWLGRDDGRGSVLINRRGRF